MTTASTAASSQESIDGNRSNSVRPGLRVSINDMISAGVATKATSVTTVVVAKAFQSRGTSTNSGAKNRIISNSNMPQNSASASDGVSSRSRRKWRTQTPNPQRSLSRNSTDSLLNCRTAQLMDSQQ